MGNDIYENGKLCRYGKIAGLEKPVSRMIFGTAIGPMIEGKNADELLDAAFAKGINTFDTARGYGRAEESLGGWMKRRNNREQVVVISKCGNCDSDGSVCVNRKVIETELAESLQALQTDYIDIYLLHRDDPKTPVSEMIDALMNCKKKEKSKYLAYQTGYMRESKKQIVMQKSISFRDFLFPVLILDWQSRWLIHGAATV